MSYAYPSYMKVKRGVLACRSYFSNYGLCYRFSTNDHKMLASPKILVTIKLYLLYYDWNYYFTTSGFFSPLLWCPFSDWKYDGRWTLLSLPPTPFWGVLTVWSTEWWGRGHRVLGSVAAPLRNGLVEPCYKSQPSATRFIRPHAYFCNANVKFWWCLIF
jgi:hypothetical protein